MEIRRDASRRTRARVLLHLFAFKVLFAGTLVVVGALALGQSRPSYRGRLAASRSKTVGETPAWTQPQSGWLYILDDNGTQAGSQVLLVDPFERTTVGVIPVGAGADIVLSPDGLHLYVASGTQGHTDVINTQTGRVESTFVTNRQVQMGGATFPSMIVSPNNRWLFVMEMTGAPPVPVNYALATYDTYHDNELVRKISIPDCGIGRLAWVGEKLIVYCYDSDSLTVLDVDATGKTTKAKPPLILKKQTRRTAHVAFSQDGENAVIFADTGAVTDVSLSGPGKVLRTAELVGERWTSAENWPQSEDGRLIYLATGPSDARHTRLATEIAIFDTTLWRYIDIIKTSVPIFSLALSKDAGFLYGISASERKILIIDTAKRAEIENIPIPGTKPTLAIVAP